MSSQSQTGGEGSAEQAVSGDPSTEGERVETVRQQELSEDHLLRAPGLQDSGQRGALNKKDPLLQQSLCKGDWQT